MPYAGNAAERVTIGAGPPHGGIGGDPVWIRDRPEVAGRAKGGLNYVTWQDRKKAVADLKPIYRAATADEAERQLTEFESKWGKYPAIARLWREQWQRVIPFFSFPAEVRKVVYTTNAVESLHMSLRKIIKTRGSFPSEEAAFKLLYLALTKLVAKWETVQHWKQMLNYLDTACGERIREAGVRR